MLAKVSELLFVEAVRRYAEALPEGQTGWLAGLRDDYVARALALLHRDVTRSWTVDELGRQVGLSRSALAERFTHLIGVAPMHYLANWRMQVAAQELRNRSSSLAQIANTVGYESEAAFSRAFKKAFGVGTVDVATFEGQGRMRDLGKQERIALDAVARRFSATWRQRSGPSDAFVVAGGRPVAVEIRTLKKRGTGQSNGAKPRLRFDKVVTRLFERLQATLGDAVPEGTTALLTVTAPIRLASKTAASLEGKIKSLLARGSPCRDERGTIHGNRVRIRVLRKVSERAPKMIGFVHNSDLDPLMLLDMTRELLELISTEASRRAPKRAGDRWLVLISLRASSSLEAYRYIYSQLGMAPAFERAVMVFGDGSVGMLTE